VLALFKMRFLDKTDIFREAIGPAGWCKRKVAGLKRRVGLSPLQVAGSIRTPEVSLSSTECISAAIFITKGYFQKTRLSDQAQTWRR